MSGKNTKQPANSHHCDCGDHKEPVVITKYATYEIPSFHNIIKKIDKMFRSGGNIVVISKL